MEYLYQNNIQELNRLYTVLRRCVKIWEYKFYLACLTGKLIQ